MTKRACPFCGSKEFISLREDLQGRLPIYYYECAKCAVLGPMAGNKHWAARKWNKRADK